MATRRELLWSLTGKVPGLKTSRRSASFLALRILPIESCPSWAAKVLNIKAPRHVERNPVLSPEGGSNIKIIFDLLQKTRNVEGDLAECGVFRGASLISIGLYLKQNSIPKTVFGLDSFIGFDDTIAIDLELGGDASVDKKVGGFSSTSHAEIATKVSRLGLRRQVEIAPGYFRDTLPRLNDRVFSFVHLDCDIYQSYKDCLEFFYPRLSPGAVVLLDEYNDPPWPGCNRAVDEFLTGKPERLVEVQSDNYQKWYFQKV